MALHRKMTAYRMDDTPGDSINMRDCFASGIDMGLWNGKAKRHTLKHLVERDTE
jgi:hypothetical protein